MPIIRRRTTPPVAAAQEQAVQVVPPNINIADPPEDVDVQSDMTDPNTGEIILPEGMAVALISVGGVLTYVPAGCLEGGSPDFFFGIVAERTVQGETATVAVGRGSIVTPLVENGSLLDNSKQVYLSVTAGRVTQDVDSIPSGKSIYRVGQAISTTQMVLNTDYREVWYISE
jgi:hypothetical protein